MKYGVLEPRLTEEQELLIRTLDMLLTRKYHRELMRKVADGEREHLKSLKEELRSVGFFSLTAPAHGEEVQAPMLDLLNVSRLSGRYLLSLGLLTLHNVVSYLITKSVVEEESMHLDDVLQDAVISPLLDDRLQLLDEERPSSSVNDRDDEIEILLNGLIIDLDLSDYVLLHYSSGSSLNALLLERKDVEKMARSVEFVDPTSGCWIVRGSLSVEKDSVVKLRLDQKKFRENLILATTLLASEMLGAAETVFELTVDYLKRREVFGRPVASYQAIKHRCAELLIKIEKLKAAIFSRNDVLRALTAKLMAGEVVTTTALEAIQLHGGIGFTWEYDVHLFLRRGRACDSLVLGFDDAQKLLRDFLISESTS